MTNPLTILLLLTLPLSAGAWEPFYPPFESVPVATQSAQSGWVNVTALGYGSPPKEPGLSTAEQRLEAMRRSRFDAMRALAEQVAGFHIQSQIRTEGREWKEDRARENVNGYLRGARVVTVTPMADGIYETTVEISLPSACLMRLSTCQGHWFSFQGPVRDLETSERYPSVTYFKD
ncbi:conserved exported hypothetical protein [Gammaproteobacteria bacterium]